MVSAAESESQETDRRGVIRMDVTGSNLPRSDSEPALPVQVITRDEILRSGATTTAELLEIGRAHV